MPFTSLRVTTMRRDTLGVFSACQSTSMAVPRKAVMASASSCAQVMFSSSPTCNSVSDFGMKIWPPRLMWVQTNSRPRNSNTLRIVLPTSASFCTTSDMWWGVA